MIYQALQAPNRGRWYKVSPAPENGLLTVHKTHYDKYHLYPSAGKGAVDRLALKGLGAYQLYIGAECRYFNTAASHELMLPLGHCPNRHFLKYAALILIFHSIAQ